VSTTTTREGGELLRACTALLNLELETVDGVRVGGNSGLVTGGSLEVDESTVL
jgi:hypothetical protein